MDDIEKVLNLEPTPNDMPETAKPWLEHAKDSLRDHFQCRVALIPVHDRAVVV